MLQVSLDFISGLALGIEHVSGDEDDDYVWAIAVHLAFVRIVFMKFY